MRNVPGRNGPAAPTGACGVFLASQPGIQDNGLMKLAKFAASQLAHRGGRLQTDEGNEIANFIGDGVGLKFRLPVPFVLEKLGSRGHNVPNERLAIGQFLLSKDVGKQTHAEEVIHNALRAKGFEILHHRHVPVDPSVLPKQLRGVEPLTMQIVMAMPHALKPVEANKLFFRTRRRIAAGFSQQQLGLDEACVVSLGRELTYKGMLTPEQLFGYYAPDLDSDLMVTDAILEHIRYSTYALPKNFLAQPFDLIAANGEITSLEALMDWIRCLEKAAGGLDPAYVDLQPYGGSDTMIVDSHIAALGAALGLPTDLIVEMVFSRAFQRNPEISEAFRRLCMVLQTYYPPAEGPSLIVGLDGESVFAKRDPGGYRPCWHAQYQSGLFVIASEPLLFPDIPETDLLHADTLTAGQMIARIGDGPVLDDDALQARWLELDVEKRLQLRTMEIVPEPKKDDDEAAALAAMSKPFDSWMAAGRQGYSADHILEVMLQESKLGQPATYSMGADAQWSILSDVPIPFDRRFLRLRHRQVVAPAKDAKLERDVMSLLSIVRSIGSPFDPKLHPGKAHFFPSPFVRPSTMRDLTNDRYDIKLGTLRAVYTVDRGEDGARARLEEL